MSDKGLGNATGEETTRSFCRETNRQTEIDMDRGAEEGNWELIHNVAEGKLIDRETDRRFPSWEAEGKLAVNK